MMKTIQIAQIVISIMLMVVILLQSKGSSLGGVFGGSSDVFRTKRGAEVVLFRATIALAIVFVALAVTGLLLSSKQLG